MSKMIFAFLIASLAVVLVCFFWRNSVLTCLLLIILTLIEHQKFPIKKELMIFILSGIWGAFFESLAIFAGVWAYSKPELINIPLWLPLLWGLVGISVVTFYEGFKK